MKYGAQETAHVSVPSANAVVWLARKKTQGAGVTPIRIVATYWIDARKQAATLMQCGVDEIIVKKEDESQ